MNITLVHLYDTSKNRAFVSLSADRTHVEMLTANENAHSQRQIILSMKTVNAYKVTKQLHEPPSFAPQSPMSLIIYYLRQFCRPGADAR